MTESTPQHVIFILNHYDSNSHANVLFNAKMLNSTHMSDLISHIQVNYIITLIAILIKLAYNTKITYSGIYTGKLVEIQKSQKWS